MLSCWKYSVDVIYSVMHLFIIVLNILCKIKSQYQKNRLICPFTKLKNLFYTKKYTYTKISVHLMFNNFCMSLLPMHKKQDYLFFLSQIYCSFYLRFVCPVEYILFMFTPHNTDLNVFSLIFIYHNIDKQKTNVNQKNRKWNV